MMEVSALSVLIVAEVLLVLALATGGLVFLFLRRRSQDRAAAARLVKAVKKESEPRQKALREILLYKYGLQGADTDQALQAFDQATKTLFQGVVNSYAKRDVEGLIGLAAQVYSLEDQYRGLQPKSEAKAAPEDEDPGIETIDISPDGVENALRTEIAQLREELSNTMETMAKMMHEYSGIFSEDSTHKIDKDKLAEWAGKKDTGDEIDASSPDPEPDTVASSEDEAADAPSEDAPNSDPIYVGDAVVDENGQKASLSMDPGEEPLVSLEDDLGDLAMMSEDGDAANDDSADGKREAS